MALSSVMRRRSEIRSGERERAAKVSRCPGGRGKKGEMDVGGDQLKNQDTPDYDGDCLPQVRRKKETIRSPQHFFIQEGRGV